MDLYFSSRRFFQTSFHSLLTKSEQLEEKAGARQLKEIYRVSTTARKGSILPDTSTIEFVGTEDEEKRYVVATITWRWPSQSSSFIEIDGKRLPVKEFLRKEGLLSTGTHFTIDDERFTWRSAVCRPTQLFNAQNRPVARLTPHVHALRPLIVQPSCLYLASELADDTYSRDFAVTSFFVYRAFRDFQILLAPWWKEKQAVSAEMRLKA